MNLIKYDLYELANIFISYKGHKLSLEEACKQCRTAITQAVCNVKNDSDIDVVLNSLISKSGVLENSIKKSLEKYRNSNKLLEDCIQMIEFVYTDPSIPVFEEPIL